MTTLSFVSIKIICLVVSLFVVCVPREGDALLDDGITFEGEVLLDVGVTFKGGILLDVGVIFEGGVLLEGPGFLDEGVTLEGVYFEIGTLFEESGFCILESAVSRPSYERTKYSRFQSYYFRFRKRCKTDWNGYYS